MQDFLIIGGGIAGVSTAARLSHLGGVTLLERETALAWHASGRSAALFEQSYGKPSTVALNMASRDYHMTANGGVLSPRGLMLVAAPGQDDAFAREARDMDLTEIAPEDAPLHFGLLNPATIAHAALSNHAWDIDTDRLIQNFAREARGNGAQILTGQTVTAITRTATGWRVDTANATHEARMIVNAAGAWVDQIEALAGLAPLGFAPKRRSMARIAAPAGMDPSGWVMVFAANEAWYAKPDAGALIVSPSEEDPVAPHDAYADDMVLAEGLARYEAHVTHPVTRMLANWAGLRTFSPDRCLVIGPDPRDPAFLWCAGQGGYGFQTAPAYSALVADLVAGRAPVLDAGLIAALSPARFLS